MQILLFSIYTLGGSLEVTALAVKLLDNRLYISLFLSLFFFSLSHSLSTQMFNTISNLYKMINTFVKIDQWLVKKTNCTMLDLGPSKPTFLKNSVHLKIFITASQKNSNSIFSVCDSRYYLHFLQIWRFQHERCNFKWLWNWVFSWVQSFRNVGPSYNGRSQNLGWHPWCDISG